LAAVSQPQSAAGDAAQSNVAVELHDARSGSSPETGAGRFFELEWPVCLSSAVLPIVQLCVRVDSLPVTALHYWTVSIALLLVTLPALLLTTTEKRLPLSAAVVAGVVYEELVAPVIFTPFLRHW